MTNAAGVYIDYTNWRGDRRIRRIVPRELWFGESPWHMEPQWFIQALDPEKGDVRDFPLTSIHKTGTSLRDFEEFVQVPRSPWGLALLLSAIMWLMIFSIVHWWVTPARAETCTTICTGGVCSTFCRD